MKMKHTAKSKRSAVVPVRVPEDMQKSIRSVAEQNHLSDADVMRLAITRGLPLIEKLFEQPAKKAA